MACLRSLKPFSVWDKEAHREASSKGGKASAEKRRRKKAWREIWRLCDMFGVDPTDWKGLYNYLAWRYDGIPWERRPFPEYGQQAREPIVLPPDMLRVCKRLHIEI